MSAVCSQFFDPEGLQPSRRSCSSICSRSEGTPSESQPRRSGCRCLGSSSCLEIHALRYAWSCVVVVCLFTLFSCCVSFLVYDPFTLRRRNFKGTLLPKFAFPRNVTLRLPGTALFLSRLDCCRPAEEQYGMSASRSCISSAHDLKARQAKANPAGGCRCLGSSSCLEIHTLRYVWSCVVVVCLFYFVFLLRIISRLRSFHLALKKF